MNATETMAGWRWTLAECHMISQYAYERLIGVEAWQVHIHLDIWRQWYYGMVPDHAVMQLPGVRHLSISAR